MGDLSTNFSRSEFRCNCGLCHKDTVDVGLLALCEDARQFVGSPVIISSGHRCWAWNLHVGGGEFSQHLYGRAADLPVSDPVALYDYLCNNHPNKYGFGLYYSFVHVDSRSRKTRWIE